jgi:hypothetical protein
MYLKAEGFDNAIIGICTLSKRIIYDRQKMLEIVMQDLNYIDAMDHLEFNVWNAYVGEYTPIYVNVMDIKGIEEFIRYENE